MGTWNQSGGVWTLTGDGVRTAVIGDEAMPSNHAPHVQITDPALQVEVVIRASPDGRTCWCVGTSGGTGGNMLIRRREYGNVVATAVTTAHGLTTGKPYTMLLEVIEEELNVYLDGSETPLQTYDLAGSLSHLDRWGFAATTDQAKVLLAEMCELIPQIQERADVLVWVANGELWCCLDGETPVLVSKGVMTSGNDVAIAEFQQKAYMVDGSRARIFEPVAQTVDKWTPTAGTLPGQTEDGTTTAKLVFNDTGRLGLARMDDDPQNILWTAVDDALDLDTGAITRGRAYALGGAGGSQSYKVGQPILDVRNAGLGVLFIGCTGQTWQKVGDPALGAIDTTPIALEDGVSGMGAMCLVKEGMLLAHSPTAGLLAIVPGAASSLSAPVLSDIQYDANTAALYRTTLVRDPERHCVMVFRTPRAGGAAVHYVYDEDVGQRSAGAGGFFEETYPDALNPTCGIVWRGQLIMGCMDGYLRRFSATSKSDDGTTAIDFKLPCAPLRMIDDNHDVKLGKVLAVLARASDRVQVRVWGGRTSEDVYDSTNRWELSPTGGRERRFNGTPITDKVRAPAVLIELSNANVGEAPIVEAVQYHATAGKLTRRWGKHAPATPPPMCEDEQDTSSSTSASDSFGTGPGNTSSSSSSSPSSTGTGSGTA